MKINLARVAKLMLGLVALMGAAGSAFAEGNVMTMRGGANVWTVYAFGNAQAVADAFRALSNFAMSGTFQSIVSMVATLGVLGVGAAGGFNPGMAKRFIGYVVSVFLICYVFFGVGNGGPLVVNVEVIDTVDMTWKAPVTVPAVVGIPASMISSAGYRMTQAIEASFSIPDALKMSNGAPFNLAASMIADAGQARITDPNLASSLAYYVQDCFTIGVAQGQLQAATLITSTDFLNDIKFDNKSIMVNTMLQPPVGNPGIVTCSDAWGLINAAITAQGTTASDFLKDASAWSKTPAMSVINAAADSTAQWATNNGVTDGGALVKQSAILSAFRGSYAQAAAQTGNSEFLTGLALSQATEAQRSSWITGAEVFNKSMGYIFAILQVFVYAITPLVLCAALVPGLGMALLKNFMQILLWLAIWQPMLAIVNFIVISMQQAELGGILSSGSAYGFTLSNMGIVSEKTANLRAAATFVGTMVPALAWAMVKGSMDFSRVIGSAVGENFAQGAANTMTTGNYSLNQSSMDSFTANKHSIAASGAQGHGFSTADATGAREMDMGGTRGVRVGEQNLGVGASATTGTNHGTTEGNGVQVGETGSQILSGTNATGVNEAGSLGDTSGGTQSSAAISAANAQGGVNGGYALVQPGKGGPANNGTNIIGAPGVPAAGGANGDGGVGPGASHPAVVGAKNEKPGRLRADANGGFTLSTTGQNSDVKTHGTTAGHNKGASINATGSEALSGGRTGSANENASRSNGTTEGENENVTGIASTEARAQAMAAYMRPHNTMTQGEWAYPEMRQSAIGDKVQKLNTAGAIAKDVETGKAAELKKENALTGEVKELEANAHKRKEQNEHAGTAEMGKAKAAVAAGEAPAHVAAIVRAGGKLEDVAQSSFEGVKDGIKHLGEKGGALGHSIAEGAAAKLHGVEEKLGIAPKEAGGSTNPSSQAPGQQTPAHRPDNHAPARPEAGSHAAPANAQAPGQQTPAQRQDNHAPARPEAGSHAAPANAHAPGQQTPAQRQDGHAPTNTGASKQPGAHGGQPHDQGNQKPEERNQTAMTDQQRKQEQQDREMQERQLAAASSVSQALQTAQVAPQAQPQPAPTGQPEAPTQLAMGPQPQQPGAEPQSTAPNPFSGEKPAESAGQMQGQVQLAEQRAEKLGTQLRGVDGTLASAEGRKVSELPDLINQARDMARNA